MAFESPVPPARAIVSPPGTPIAVSGGTLAVHEWTMSGPQYLHIHKSDDEIWHVLEGSLSFRFSDGSIEAPLAPPSSFRLALRIPMSRTRTAAT